jgi:hypothetical protein
MMPSTPKLRTLEQLFGLLAWGSFGLGAVAVLGLFALSLLAEPQTSPEQFLLRLALILACALVPTALFRALAALCRRERARRRPGPPGLIGSLSLFEDSTLGK